MLTKILNNNLTDRTNAISDIQKAITGTWGNTVSDDEKTHVLYSSRQSTTFVYGGKELTNPSESFIGLATIIYTDNSTDHKAIDPKSTISLTKNIKIATIIAQTI